MRFVGDPVRRIDEDVLRLLRFFRFFAHYGRPAMDGPALAACRKLAPRLGELSGERVAGELIRLLQAPDPASVLGVMKTEGILAQLLPEAQDLTRLRVLCWLETRALARPGLGADPLRRLGAMVVADAAGVRALGERLKLSAAQTLRLSAIVVPEAAMAPDMGRAAARRALRHLGMQTVRDLILVAWAGWRAHSGKINSAQSARWQNLLDLCDSWQPVSLPVRGADCLDLGLPRGPAIGRALARVEAWWEAADYQPDRAACLERLRAVVAEAMP